VNSNVGQVIRVAPEDGIRYRVLTHIRQQLDNFLRLGAAEAPHHRVVLIVELNVGRAALDEELVNRSVEV
jgi:hypothetical protein